MKILITGISGFAGYQISLKIREYAHNIQVVGLDNLSRKGSEHNISQLCNNGIELIRGDIRLQSDIDSLPLVDWVIDCAANPSVLAGNDGQVSSKQLMEHNLLGTINLLEYCKKYKAGLILLSTSRVYSAYDLAKLPVEALKNRFEIKKSDCKEISDRGIAEMFPTTSPISLNGVSKLASEGLALEYSNSFDFPVWINRCGVLGGAGQFGKADQGIISFWIHSYKENKPLNYIGFNGTGHQVRDILHPNDLLPLLIKQINAESNCVEKIINIGGGRENSISLKELSIWCEKRFGIKKINSSNEKRSLDAPWIIMDISKAREIWQWEPSTNINEILDEIANFAEKNPNWLNMCQ